VFFAQWLTEDKARGTRTAVCCLVLRRTNCSVSTSNTTSS